MRIKNAFEMRSMFYKQYQSIHNYWIFMRLISWFINRDIYRGQQSRWMLNQLSRIDKYRISHSIFNLGPGFGPERWCLFEPVEWGPIPLEGQFQVRDRQKYKKTTSNISFQITLFYFQMQNTFYKLGSQKASFLYQQQVKTYSFENSFKEFLIFVMIFRPGYGLFCLIIHL